MSLSSANIVKKYETATSRPVLFDNLTQLPKNRLSPYKIF